MKRFLFPAVLLLVLSAVLVGQDALAGTGMGIKLPEDPTKAYITLGILVVAAIMFFTEIVPLPITALLVPVALSLTKVITSKVAFSYFGDPTVILFMAMFIVGEATFITGFADKVGALAVRLSKGNTVLLLVYTMAAVGLALWGMLAVAGVDNVLRPLFLRQGINAPFFVLILAILCGLASFGPVGLIAGPVLLSFAMQAVEEANHFYKAHD